MAHTPRRRLHEDPHFRLHFQGAATRLTDDILEAAADRIQPATPSDATVIYRVGADELDAFIHAAGETTRHVEHRTPHRYLPLPFWRCSVHWHPETGTLQLGGPGALTLRRHLLAFRHLSRVASAHDEVMSSSSFFAGAASRGVDVADAVDVPFGPHGRVWRLYADGSARDGRAGWGWVLQAPHGPTYWAFGPLPTSTYLSPLSLGAQRCSSTEAELHAACEALEALYRTYSTPLWQQLGVHVEICLDLLHVVHVLVDAAASGADSELAAALRLRRDQVERRWLVRVTHVDRNAGDPLNVQADRLAAAGAAGWLSHRTGRWDNMRAEHPEWFRNMAWPPSPDWDAPDNRVPPPPAELPPP